MKSLKESLFDKDIITKDVVFGDLYELDLTRANIRDRFRRKIIAWFKKSLLKDTGESDPYIALAKVILNTPIKDQEKFKSNLIQSLISYLKSDYDGYGPIINIICNNSRSYNSNILDNETTTVAVRFNRFGYYFKRK